MVEELDYLYKVSKNQQLFFKNKKIYWITKKTNLFSEFEEHYSNNFNFTEN